MRINLVDRDIYKFQELKDKDGLEITADSIKL
jgi:hypothetical protein